MDNSDPGTKQALTGHGPHRVIGAATVLFLAASLGFAGVARADSSSDFPAERMHGVDNNEGIIAIESAWVLPHLHWDVGFWADYERDPITAYSLTSNRPLGAFVSSRIGASVTGAVGLFGFAELGLEMPFILYQWQDASVAGLEGGSSSLAPAGLGDLRIVPKIRFLDGSWAIFDAALILGVTLPTGGGSNYFGDSGVTFSPQLAISKHWRGIRIGGSIYVTLRKQTDIANEVVQSELEAELGLGFRFKEWGGAPVELGATLSGGTSVTQPFKSANQGPLEARASVGYDFESGLNIWIGPGIGLQPGWGTPEWRVFAGLRYTPPPPPPPAPPPPAPPPPPPPPPPNPDRDGDGIPNELDRCPDEPGPKENGGCPDKDIDADGIPDRLDRCPEKPGPQANGGCPDFDSDGDGIPDRLDNCPDQAGISSRGGCPEPAGIEIEEEDIKVDNIYFDSNKATLQERSVAVLKNLASVLKKHTEILELRIEGHTDSVGSDAFNLDLSQRRVRTVMQWLIKDGVEPGRLTNKGFGESTPVADNDTPEGREKNRRVVFAIVKRAPKSGKGKAVPAPAKSGEQSAPAKATP